ncbi:MAG: efflux RND transporter periplasmic adaptor subunit [Anaerolineales bacterium]|nr:efflux RND transporter periplasmic adaptor subunit [Anaerolineales bacterium]MCX7756194.1 efflux RND transporter periplasmic adaptor subunit [Anaerolineales bacterium]MDW8277446.1 efflux RND transporter periplasmic adaptor subunit [Anaerolineales bacterium]
MKRTSLLAWTLTAFLLAACASGAGAPQALPTVALDGSNLPPTVSTAGSDVTASGTIVPAQEAKMAFAVGGIVRTVNVKVGQTVRAGDLLVELDNTTLQLELAQAERTLREMTSQASIAAALQAVANARKELEDAQKKAESLKFRRGSDTVIENTQAEIDLARQALARASEAYRQVQSLPDGDPKKASALLAMTNAQLRLNALIAKYNYLTGAPTDLDAALIQARLETAQAAYQEAQWYLSALKGEQIPPEATGTKLAALQSARDAIAAIRQRLDATRLVAPIDGVITRVGVTVGEYAVPAQPLVFISDVEHLQVQTTDLSERDVVKVQVGQKVTVFVEALNETLTGKVVLISPVSSTLGGDVVYQTTIELDRPFPKELRAGMSADVTFQTE